MTIVVNTGSGKDENPLMTSVFSVTLDGKSLGRWTNVDLGGVKVAIEAVEEGGNQGFVHNMPGRITYQNIKLTRQVDKATSEVANWFDSMTGQLRRGTGEIVMYDALRYPVLTWRFVGAIPVNWTLPKLGVDSVKAATEVLEIAHHGFQS